MTDTTTAPASGPASTPPSASQAPSAAPVAMAAAPDAVATTAYVAAASYDVTLKRVIEWPANSGIYHSPRDHHIWTGAVCLENADGIESAKPVQ